MVLPEFPVVISSSYSVGKEKTSNKCQILKFQMGITGMPFGRTEVLVPPLEPQERDLAQGKGPRGPGGCYYRKMDLFFF